MGSRTARSTGEVLDDREGRNSPTEIGAESPEYQKVVGSASEIGESAAVVTFWCEDEIYSTLSDANRNLSIAIVRDREMHCDFAVPVTRSKRNFGAFRLVLSVGLPKENLKDSRPCTEAFYDFLMLRYRDAEI